MGELAFIPVNLRKFTATQMEYIVSLLSLAGLVFKETVKSLLDRGELLRALLEMAELPANAEKYIFGSKKAVIY